MAKRPPTPPIHVHNRIGFLCGLMRESQIVDRPEFRGGSFIRVAGTSPKRAYDMARQLAQSGVAGLISFGFCGGLAAELKAGDLIVADHVVTEDGERWQADAKWRAAVQEAAQRLNVPVRVINVCGTERVVRMPHEKAELALRVRASVVDMESRALAQVATDRKLPFLVLRAVADDARTAIPPTALKAIDGDGRTRFGPVLRGILTRPQDIAGLIRLGAETRAAERSLHRAARNLLPSLFRVVHLL